MLVSRFVPLGVAGAGLLLAGVAISSTAPESRRPRFPDAHEAPPRDWKGPVFRLRTDYPTRLPRATGQTWRNIDFRREPERYMNAVLEYSLEGNLEANFDLFKNKKRNWYHVPWLHWGPAGREFINGFTVELTANPGKLGPLQKTPAANISIGFYNDVAGYTLGKVWNTSTPRYGRDIKFEEGAVTFKTLHVDASVAELPYLKGSPAYLAYIPRDPGGVTPTGDYIPPSADRHYRYVRLMQIDIGVRDRRADSGTGWVFGTYVYDGNLPGNDPWKKLVPVGLMWGNSPGVMPGDNKPLPEQWINPKMQLFAWRQKPGMGYAGRMNGPLDNPDSACLSCHGTGQFVNAAPLAFMPGASASVRKSYFNNVKAGGRFKKDGGPSTDYSLQLAMSVSNWLEWKEVSQGMRSPEALTATDLPNSDRLVETRNGSFFKPSVPPHKAIKQ